MQTRAAIGVPASTSLMIEIKYPESDLL